MCTPLNPNFVLVSSWVIIVASIAALIVLGYSLWKYR